MYTYSTIQYTVPLIPQASTFKGVLKNWDWRGIIIESPGPHCDDQPGKESHQDTQLQLDGSSYSVTLTCSL